MTITFMDRVESVLKEKRLTQKALAEKLSLRRPSLSDWKKNGSVPAGDICIKIADYLNVSVEWLVTGREGEVSNEEKKLLAQWKLLTADQKDTVLTLIDKWEADRRTGEKRNTGA